MTNTRRSHWPLMISRSRRCSPFFCVFIPEPRSVITSAGRLPTQLFFLVVTADAGVGYCLAFNRGQAAGFLERTEGVAPVIAGRTPGRVELAAQLPAAKGDDSDAT